jgi:hypothetical protein
VPPETEIKYGNRKNSTVKTLLAHAQDAWSNSKDTVPHKTFQVFWFFSFFACHQVLGNTIGSMLYLI